MSPASDFISLLVLERVHRSAEGSRLGDVVSAVCKMEPALQEDDLLNHIEVMASDHEVRLSLEDSGELCIGPTKIGNQELKFLRARFKHVRHDRARRMCMLATVITAIAVAVVSALLLFEVF